MIQEQLSSRTIQELSTYRNHVTGMDVENRQAVQQIL